LAPALRRCATQQRRSKPIQNAFIESFNGRLRDELLNETLFSSLSHVRVLLATWRRDYNENRPRSRLGGRTPAEFAETFPRRGPALRKADGFAPTHNIRHAHEDKSHRQSELRAG
jgi:putative transposase